MSRFGELPEIFEYGGIDLWTFSYDVNQKAFQLGGECINLKDEELYRKLLIGVGEPIRGEDVQSITAALSVWGHPITSPKFFSWLTKHETLSNFEETAQQTSEVMRKIFSEYQSIDLNESHHKEMHPFGFNCEFIREGHLTLSVLGNCACMGVVPDGHIIDSDDWGTGWSEFSFHNIDMPAQHISLLAGLGHLAILCEESE